MGTPALLLPRSAMSLPRLAPPRKSRLLRALRRWAPYGIVAGGLLAASEMLWLWQTWPVREMLSTAAGVP